MRWSSARLGWLVAALVCASAGLRTVIVEKAPVIGGTTALRAREPDPGQPSERPPACGTAR